MKKKQGPTKANKPCMLAPLQSSIEVLSVLKENGIKLYKYKIQKLGSSFLNVMFSIIPLDVIEKPSKW